MTQKPKAEKIPTGTLAENLASIHNPSVDGLEALPISTETDLRLLEHDTQIMRNTRELTFHDESLEFYGKEDHDLEELTRSISLFGFLQPLVVCGNEVQVGNRRLRAAIQLGIEQVPVIQVKDRFPMVRVIGSQVYRIKPPSIILKELKILDELSQMRQGRRTDLHKELLLEIDKWKEQTARTPGAIARYRRINRYGDMVFGDDKEKWTNFLASLDAGNMSITRALQYLKAKYVNREAKQHAAFFTETIGDYDLYRSDAFGLKEVGDASIQCIMTQPPLYQGGDGNSKELGKEKSKFDYVNRLIVLMEEAKRVLKPDGSLWIVVGDAVVENSYSLIPSLFALQMLDRGWILNDEVIWCHPMGVQKDRRRPRGHQYLYHFVLGSHFKYFSVDHFPKTPPYQGQLTSSHITTLKGLGKSKKKLIKEKDVSGEKQVVLDAYSENFTEFLAYVPIMLTTERSDKVLDLFAGIGTVGKVAIENGRDFVGYDIDKGILRIASILLDGCNKTPEPKYGTLTEVPDLMAWVQEV